MKTKYCSGITQAQGYLPHVVMFQNKTLDPDYLAPKQFSKMAEGLDDFACACVFIFPLVAFVLALIRASLVKTRIKTESKLTQLTQCSGKRVQSRTSHNWFWFYF